MLAQGLARAVLMGQGLAQGRRPALALALALELELELGQVFPTGQSLAQVQVPRPVFQMGQLPGQALELVGQALAQADWYQSRRPGQSPTSRPSQS